MSVSYCQGSLKVGVAYSLLRSNFGCAYVWTGFARSTAEQIKGTRPRRSAHAEQPGASPRAAARRRAGRQCPPRRTRRGPGEAGEGRAGAARTGRRGAPRASRARLCATGARGQPGDALRGVCTACGRRKSRRPQPAHTHPPPAHRLPTGLLAGRGASGGVVIGWFSRQRQDQSEPGMDARPRRPRSGRAKAGAEGQAALRAEKAALRAALAREKRRERSEIAGSRAGAVASRQNSYPPRQNSVGARQKRLVFCLLAAHYLAA